MGHGSLECHAETVFTRVGQEIDRIGDRCLGRQLLAQHVGHRLRQGRKIQAFEGRAVGANHARSSGVRKDERTLAEPLRETTKRLGGQQKATQALNPHHAAGLAKSIDCRIVVGYRGVEIGL